MFNSFDYTTSGNPIPELTINDILKAKKLVESGYKRPVAKRLVVSKYIYRFLILMSDAQSANMFNGIPVQVSQVLDNHQWGFFDQNDRFHLAIHEEGEL